MSNDNIDKDLDRYFAVLKGEKKVKVDWSFDDFMTSVAEKEVTKKKIISLRPILYWSAAAVFILALGSYYFLKQESGMKQIARTPINQQKPATKMDVQLVPPNKVVANELPVKKAKKQRLKQKEISPTPIETQYNPEYVVINGEPIYDLQEAKEATLKSLDLLASNVDKSVSSMENVKHMSIKF